ncbi:Scr1 family TA system antitoxin-like transcriptional regulator [Streptomyces niveus]|uniref:Scr1 family TA system antitoxin-like transcriptional regulator n=1 Tax=Streptomyces niveus TaxID=193462 RepID=UPI0033E2A7EC
MSRPRSGPTAALRLLGADLRARREAAGVTLEAAAESLGVHRATVSRLERAHTGPNPKIVSELLHLYGAPKEEAEAVLRALKEAKEPGWWHPWRDVLPEYLAGVIDLESAADLIRVYSPGVVPELLQTPGYARALLQLRYPRATGEEVDRLLRLLRERQEHTLRRPVRPVRLWALIEDVVLQRPVGGPSAMTEQMNFLDHYTRHRGSGITVQVIPTAVGDPAAAVRAGINPALRPSADGGPADRPQPASRGVPHHRGFRRGPHLPRGDGRDRGPRPTTYHPPADTVLREAPP